MNTIGRLLAFIRAEKPPKPPKPPKRPVDFAVSIAGSSGISAELNGYLDLAATLAGSSGLRAIIELEVKPMANFAINITDIAGDDTWTFEVREAPTLASGGTVLANGATVAGDLHQGFAKAIQAIKNEISKDGNS